MQQPNNNAGNSRNGVQVVQQRKIKPTRRSNSGYFPFQDGPSIPYESTLERDFLRRTTFAVNVIEVIAQPAEIPFQGVNGQTYLYTPDFLVYFRQEARAHQTYPFPLLVEVKPETEWRAHWREWSNKWKAAGRYAAEQGWRFRIMDEGRIRDQALETITFLEQFKRTEQDEALNRFILSLFPPGVSSSVREIAAGLRPSLPLNSVTSAVWHLVALRKLDCGLGQPLTVDTPIWKTRHG